MFKKFECGRIILYEIRVGVCGLLQEGIWKFGCSRFSGGSEQIGGVCEIYGGILLYNFLSL